MGRRGAGAEVRVAVVCGSGGAREVEVHGAVVCGEQPCGSNGVREEAVRERRCVRGAAGGGSGAGPL